MTHHPLIGMRVVDRNPGPGEVQKSLIEQTLENVVFNTETSFHFATFAAKFACQTSNSNFKKTWTVVTDSNGIIKQVKRS